MSAAAIVEKENNDHNGDKKVKWVLPGSVLLCFRLS